MNQPVPMAAQSKAWIFVLSLTGIAGSNPACGISVYLLGFSCVVRVRSHRRTDNSSRGVVPSAVCLSMIVKPR